MEFIEERPDPEALATPATLGTAALASAALAACGGADPLAPPAQFFDLGQARTQRHLLGLPADNSERAAAAPTVRPTPAELFDWAERSYPGLFPGHSPDLISSPYIYRYYPASRNYAGVAGQAVYVLGPLSADVLAYVGELNDFAPLVLVARFAFDDAQAARFLAQATLAPSDEAVAAVRGLGYDAWLALEFGRPPSTSNWDWLVSKGIDQDPDARNSARGVDAQIWQRLLSAPDSLRQRVALALSEIFVVGFDGVTGPWRQFKMAAWWDLLAAGAFGSYRALLEAVTRSAAMGLYLNTAGNQKENTNSGRVPDENYAREVMQLFSIGVHQLNPDGSARLDAAGRPIESYTQDMVSQLARVFTGWNLDAPRADLTPELARRPMVLNAALHSTLAANFLGATVPANSDGATALRIALDTLANHPNVGPFMASQLIRKLVTSNPSRAYVARVAARFADNGTGVRGDLSAVVRAVLTDDEARNAAGLSQTGFGKLREPMLRFVQWARAFKASSLSGDWNVGNTSDAATRLGQSPLRSPSVFNYFRPGYVPAGTAIAAQALVAPEFQLANESSVAGYLNYMQNAVGNGHGDIKPNYAAELALAGDATALLARVESLLCAGQLQAATRATIVAAIHSISAGTDTGKANRVHTAVLLVLACPDYLIQK